jgi:seryl-tRNA synthetase
VASLQEVTAANKAMKELRDASTSALYRLRTGHKTYVEQLHERAHDLERLVNGSVSSCLTFRGSARSLVEELVKEQTEKGEMKQELSALQSVADQRHIAVTKTDAQLQAAISKTMVQSAAVTRLENEQKDLVREVEELKGKLQSSSQQVRSLEGLHEEVERQAAEKTRQHQLAFHGKTAELQETAKVMIMIVLCSPFETTFHACFEFQCTVVIPPYL